MPQVMKAEWSQASGFHGPLKGPSKVPSIMVKDAIKWRRRRERFLSVAQ